MNTFQGTYVFDAIEPILAWTEGCQGFDISWPTAIKLELLATRITWISKEIQTNVLAMLITGISRIIKILYVYCYIYIYTYCYIYIYILLYIYVAIYIYIYSAYRWEIRFLVLKLRMVPSNSAGLDDAWTQRWRRCRRIGAGQVIVSSNDNTK